MRPNFKLVPDFIIPNLERATYGRHLIWEDKKKGSFKVSRIHQSSELWSDECIAVYKAWSSIKKLWKSDDPKNVTKAKHRLITALRRNPIVEMLQTESAYYRFRLIKMISLEDVSSMEIDVSMKELETETDHTVICPYKSSYMQKSEERETCSGKIFKVHPGKSLIKPEIPICPINAENEWNDVYVSVAPYEVFPGMCNTLEENTKCSNICCCDILLDSTLLSNERCIWHGALS